MIGAIGIAMLLLAAGFFALKSTAVTKLLEWLGNRSPLQVMVSFAIIGLVLVLYDFVYVERRNGRR